jgi:hypothetical protein
MEKDYILLYYQDAQDVLRRFKVTSRHSRLSSRRKVVEVKRSHTKKCTQEGGQPPNELKCAIP